MRRRRQAAGEWAKNKKKETPFTTALSHFNHFYTSQQLNHYKQKQQQTIYHCNESFQPFVHFDLVKPTVAARCDTLTPRPLSSILSNI